jgi:hypothetical protein
MPRSIAKLDSIQNNPLGLFEIKAIKIMAERLKRGRIN